MFANCLPARDWFAVLPDCDQSRSVAATLCARSPRVVKHASGRPWIVGHWPEDEMTLATGGRVSVAVIGCSINATSLLALVGRVHDVADFDQLARNLPGCFHLVASVADDVRVQGSVSTVRQIYHARVDGITVASDSIELLVSLAGATMNDDAAALRMAYPQLPYPLDDLCHWHEVQNLPPDCYLLLKSADGVRARRWWSPPSAVQSLREGADALRQVLADAVAVRTAEGGVTSADLSGGMDSTSLCYLAAARADRLLTVRRVEADPGSDDDLWARRAAADLPNAEHLVFAHNEAPLIYADVADFEGDPEGPFRWVRTRGRHVHLVELLAKRKCRQHFTGHGGDELFGTFPSYLHTLTRTHPRIAVGHLRGYRGLRRWSWQETMRALADRTTFAEWLAACAEQLTSPHPVPTTPQFGWGWPVRMPPWATPGAIEAARDLVRTVATTVPQPLAESRAQHEVLQYVRTCGRAVRQVARLASDAGVRLAAPYLDDRVIEAALAVRLHERMTPWHYKPLLATAMHGIVPGAVLSRTTKGDFTADVYAGLKRHRASILNLFADSVLARKGLIDTDALRRTVCGMHPNFATLIPLEQTVACEIWLRAAADVRPRA